MIKGVKSIAEYYIRYHLEQEGFVIECFHFEMTGDYEAVIKDKNGESRRLIYDKNRRIVVFAEE